MEMERRVIQLRIDAETGEKVGEICEGDRVITKSQIDSVKNYTQKFDKEHGFMKVYRETLQKLSLTPQEKLMMYELMNFISYKDNFLRYNDVFLDIKTIAVLLEREYEATRRNIKRLVDKGILAMVRTGCVSAIDKHSFKAYVFNPYICSCGSVMYTPVLEIFKAAGWDFGNIGTEVLAHSEV